MGFEGFRRDPRLEPGPEQHEATDSTSVGGLDGFRANHWHRPEPADNAYVHLVAASDSRLTPIHTAEQWAGEIMMAKRDNHFNYDQLLKRLAHDVKLAYLTTGASGFIEEINKQITGPFGPELVIHGNKATLVLRESGVDGVHNISALYNFDLTPTPEEIALLMGPRR